MTKEIKSLWGCIIVLSACVLVLGGVLLTRIDVPKSSKGKVEMGQSQDGSEVIAIVGNEAIREEQWIKELQRQYGSMVLERMMATQAVQKEAKALGITVTDDEVNAELRMQMYGYESEEAYYTAMQEQLGMSPEQIMQDLQDHLLLERVAIHGIDVSEEDIDAYMDTHSEVMRNPVSLELSHIVVPDLETAKLASQQLESGESFAQVAEALSTDTFTAEQGGRLGWIDDTDPFLATNERMAAILMDVGTWSVPIKVDAGYAIVMLTGRKEIELRTSKVMREAARKDIALSKVPPLIEVENQLKEKYNARLVNDHAID